MNYLFRINFEDLYRRHLCRHGPFAINVLHLVAVVGIYISLFGIVDGVLAAGSFTSRSSILVGLIVPWFLVVVKNVPLKVSIATAVFVTMLLIAFRMLPTIPVWIWPMLIIAMHQFQQFSHRIYHMERDMADFDRRYPKGRSRFVLLLIYELPILLNYLCYGRKDWDF